MIRRLPWFIGATLVSLPLVFSMLGAGGISSTLVIGVADAQSVGNGPCGLSQPAFCETFDQPAGVTNRSGQLNNTLWGVSRAIGPNNFGQGQFNAASTTQLQTCGGTTSVQPPNDVIVCNGQVREAVNDNTGVTSLAMYPKQPFDFAGRTGTIAFDVSNDSQGIHTVWPEVWITDQPVPDPFTHFGSWLAAPRNSVGIRFSAVANAGQGPNIGPSCPNDSHTRWSVDSVVTSRNYVIDDQANFGAFRATNIDCVISSTGPGSMNHVEVHVSQNQIDVYATDAGTMAPLHHIAVVQNANLSFTRGLVWLEDAHYNADKYGSHNQMQHTFAWDNLGFDGPVLPRDLTFDVPDALLPVPNNPGEVNLGWGEGPNEAKLQVVAGVTGIQNASAALLTFSFFQPDQAPPTINYTVNGNAHSVGWPYPDTTAPGGGTTRTLAVPVPLSEILPGLDIVSISSGQAMVISNVDLVLVGAGGSTGSGDGGGSVSSTSTATPTPITSPPTQTPTNSPTPASATGPATPTPTSAAAPITQPQPQAAPTCALAAVIAGPPKQIQIRVQGNGGLASIVATTATNATVSIPAFTVGTTGPVIVTATKIDQTSGATVILQAADVAGNVTVCDPEMVTVNGGPGKPVSKVVTGVAQVESTVSIYNNTPGLKQLDVTVNGKLFKVIGLRDGEVRTIEVSAGLRAGKNNTIVLTPRSSTGSAEVVISDLGKHAAAQHATKHVVADLHQ